MNLVRELRSPPGEGALRGGERQARSAFLLVSREPTVRRLISLEALVLTAVWIAFLLLRKNAGAGEREGDRLFEDFLFWVTAGGIATVFSVAVACAVDARIDGVEGDLRTAFGEVRRRLPALLSWCLISIVGAIALSMAAREVMPPAPSILVVSLVWGIGSVFVVPAIAVLGTGPLESFAEALRLLRVRWRRALAGLFLIGFLFGFGFSAIGVLLRLTIHGQPPAAEEPLWRLALPLLLFYLLYALATATREGFAVILARDALGDLPGEPPPVSPPRRRARIRKRIAYGALAVLVVLFMIGAIFGHHRSRPQPAPASHAATYSAASFASPIRDPDAKHPGVSVLRDPPRMRVEMRGGNAYLIAIPG